MTKPLTIECDLHLERRRKGRQALSSVVVSGPELEAGRVPRVARLLALAIRFEELVRTGRVAGYGELARLGRVTPARISQIMSLLLLAPDLQEQLLFLPRTYGGRDPIQMQHLLPLAREWDWGKQRRLWARLRRHLCPAAKNVEKTRQNSLEVASPLR